MLCNDASNHGCCPVPRICHYPHSFSLWLDAVIIPALGVGRLKQSEMKWLGQGHVASKQQSWVSNADLLGFAIFKNSRPWWCLTPSQRPVSIESQILLGWGPSVVLLDRPVVKLPSQRLRILPLSASGGETSSCSGQQLTDDRSAC